jgi:hypothetical protein
MRQVHLETMMYLETYDGQGKFCDAFCMGLPPFPSSDRIKSQFVLRPPRAPHPLTPLAGMVYVSNFADPPLDIQSLKWDKYAEQLQGASILYIDPFNNSAKYPLDAGALIARRIYGISYDGSLVSLRDLGDWQKRQWWLDHQKKGK